MDIDLGEVLSDLVYRGWDNYSVKHFIITKYNYKWSVDCERLLYQIRANLKEKRRNEM